MALAGLALLFLGGLFLAAGRVPWIGRLPGDFRLERPGFSLYFPLATCLLASALLSFLTWLFSRFK